MTALASVNKTAIERKRYTVDYSGWLESGESLSAFSMNISPSTSPALLADGAFISGDFSTLTVYFSRGLANTTYTIQFISTTNQGQVKRDDMQLQVMP